MRNLFNQQSILGIATVGMAIVILTGGIDLSVGSIMALAGVYYSNLIRGYLFTYMPPFMKVYEEAGKVSPVFPEPFTLLFAIGTISLLGVLAGFLVAKLQAPPFVVTLGISIFARGLAYSMTSGQPIFSVPNYIVDAGFSTVARVPVLTIVWFLVIALFCCFLRYSPLGRSLYMVGGNLEAAKVTGIRVDRTIIFAYWSSGALAALAGILLVGRMASADPRVASGTTLEAIAAAVIGGFSLSGGRGNLLGTVWGVLLIGIVTNILSILGVEFYTQQVIKG
ncbi:MAG: ABC transporter permease [Candidatus Methanomethylicaceae archaeon]